MGFWLLLSSNPSTGIVSARANVSGHTGVAIRITDLQGRPVFNHAVADGMSSVDLTINLSDLPKGIYNASLVEKGRNISAQRLVIQ
jgi:hypothetical protein